MNIEERRLQIEEDERREAERLEKCRGCWPKIREEGQGYRQKLREENRKYHLEFRESTSMSALRQ